VATIKSQTIDGQRRIVTNLVDGKRRVSCTCCDACCLYPARGIVDGGYTEDDLPTSLKINWPYRFNGIVNKSGSGYVNGTISLAVEDQMWVLRDVEDNALLTVGKCLVVGDGNLTPNDNIVEDQFADTYSVDIDYENIGNWEAWIREVVTVSRVGLCEWRGLDSCGRDVRLGYSSVDIAAAGQPIRLAKWFVEFNTNTNDGGSCGAIGLSDDWVVEKTSSANTPAGEYGDYPATIESAGGAIVS